MSWHILWTVCFRKAGRLELCSDLDGAGALRLGEGSQGLKDIAKISLEISFKIPRFWDFWSLRQHRALRLHLEHTGCKRSLDANVGQDLRKSHWLTVSACFKKYFQPRDFVSFVSWEQFETKCLAISLRETLTQRDQTPFLIFLQKVSLPSKVGRLVVDCATSACNGGEAEHYFHYFCFALRTSGTFELFG